MKKLFTIIAVAALAAGVSASCQKEEEFKNQLVFDGEQYQFDGVEIEFQKEDGIRINPRLVQNSTMKELTIDFARSLVGSRVDLSAIDV